MDGQLSAGSGYCHRRRAMILLRAPLVWRWGETTNMRAPALAHQMGWFIVTLILPETPAVSPVPFTTNCGQARGGGGGRSRAGAAGRPCGCHPSGRARARARARRGRARAGAGSATPVRPWQADACLCPRLGQGVCGGGCGPARRVYHAFMRLGRQIAACRGVTVHAAVCSRRGRRGCAHG